MALDAADFKILENCDKSSCLTNIAVAAVVSASSAVVSGSVVAIGNMIYWKERNKNCRRGEPYISPKDSH